MWALAGLLAGIVAAVWLSLCLLAVLGFGLGIWLIWDPNHEETVKTTEIQPSKPWNRG